MKKLLMAAVAASVFALGATETENNEFRIVRAPGAVTVDAEAGDWNLAGSIFCCPDVEKFRKTFACWIAAMYDAENLYFYIRWFDGTPMNNPGLAGSDYPWQGDCLQMRLATSPNSKTVWNDIRHNSNFAALDSRFAHFEFWRDRAKTAAAGATLDYNAQPKGADVMSKGVKEAFKELKGGYAQEIAVPWSLVCEGAYRPSAGDRMLLTFEPNFRTSGDQRLSVKEFFRKGVAPDRSMTFMRADVWGVAEFTEKCERPQPVRLADGRLFPVEMKNGEPVADFSALRNVKVETGFLPIKLEVPADGNVSAIVKDAAGRVVANPFNNQPLPKGETEILWNGLGSCYDTFAADPVPAGEYTYEAIWHEPLHLELQGWAHASGPNPYDFAGGGWGGDHGDPCAVACDQHFVYLGWARAEAGQSVVAVDLDGEMVWHHKRGGFGTARALAADRAGHVYVYDAGQGNTVYRLNAELGAFDNFPDAGSAEFSLDRFKLGLAKRMRYEDGRLEFVFEKEILSIAVGDLKDVKRWPATESDLRIAVGGGAGSAAFIATGDPDHQISVVKNGEKIRSIGRKGGRRLEGKWDREGFYNIAGLALDDKGFLWVAESDALPRRFSKWNAATGEFVAEFFGSTVYGALGGAILAGDPKTMIGQGLEWKLDGKNLRAEPVGYVSRKVAWGNSRTGVGKNGHDYAAIGGWWMMKESSPVKIFERIEPGVWKHRATLTLVGKGYKVWSDENGDENEQPEEIHDYSAADLKGWINGWYMPMAQNLSFFSGAYVLSVTGWTRCGAPLYDFTRYAPLPANVVKGGCGRGGMGAGNGIASEDGKFAVYNAQYNTKWSYSPLYEIASGKEIARLPNCYVGVHGGHSAPPAKRGLIRGAYDFIGTAKFPEPLGNIFVIGTDKGEWHIVNDKGYYVSNLFEPEPMLVEWPEEFKVGTFLDRTPPGQGSEDFGGSMTRAKDGELYVMFGKTAFINAKMTGLKSVKRIASGKIVIGENEIAKAKEFQAKLKTGKSSAFTCDFETAGEEERGEGDGAYVIANKLEAAEELVFGSRGSRIHVKAACDGKRFCFEYRVPDRTPWVNGSTDWRNMYAMGDTVDFQLSDPNGDLRVSVGGLAGETAATLYKPVSKGEKAPHRFFSGVYREGVEWALVKKIPVEASVVRGDREYLIAWSIALADLGLDARTIDRLADRSRVAIDPLRGDFGVTFGDMAGKDTVQRIFRFNHETGIVADEVEELKLQPQNWGELRRL